MGKGKSEFSDNAQYIWLTGCCCSVSQSCPTPCDPMDCSLPGLPVLLHLPEFAQVHVHCIGGAIQPCYPLMPCSPSALNLSQHQGLFQSPLFASDNQATGASGSASASVLPVNIQGWSPLRSAYWQLAGGQMLAPLLIKIAVRVWTNLIPRLKTRGKIAAPQ